MGRLDDNNDDDEGVESYGTEMCEAGRFRLKNIMYAAAAAVCIRNGAIVMRNSINIMSEIDFNCYLMRGKVEEDEC
jgi:hypothetical protein